MTNRTKIINANSLHTVESLRRWASCCFSQFVSRMLATVLEWLTDFLTGAVMESWKAARSKVAASPPCIWVSPGHLPSREVHRKSEPHDVICSHGDVDVQMLLPFIFEQLLHLYLPIHMHALPFPCTYRNTCLLSELSEHCMSHSARFKNTIIELLETSKNPQISKGVDALKQLFLRKKDTVPRCYSLFRKCVLIKSPLMTQVGQASC